MAGTDQTFISSRTDTVTATAQTTSAVTGMDVYRRASFYLTVSSATGSGTFTLDCAIQALIGGSTWTDLARFAQVTSATTRILWDVGGTVNTATTIEEATQSLAMTVATKRAGPWGGSLRAIYTITITGTLSVTWEVKGSMAT